MRAANSKNSLFNLQGRVALVTGGGSGLGREFCHALAQYGAAVICADLSLDRAAETCAEIRRYSQAAAAVGVDVSQYEQVRDMFANLEHEYGTLDVLVNNAGITAKPSRLDEVDVRDWRRVVDVNLSGVFYCMKEGLRIMKKQKKGVIVNISSILGQIGLDPRIMADSMYVATKFGVNGLTRQAAAEYGQDNIRVNCIAPGWHHSTKLGDEWRKQAGIMQTEGERLAFEKMIIERTPLMRMGNPKELKSLLLYLASDASSFVTGQVFVQDGGWTCC